MPFPTTGILDNFNRADENPITGWTALFNGFRVVSNAMKGTTAGSNFAYYSAATYGPDCECYMTIATKVPTGGAMAVLARLVDTGSIGTIDGYILNVAVAAGTDTITIQRLDNGVGTTLGSSISQEVSNGDSIGIECIGSSISCWYKASGGSWTNLGTRTDSTYTAAGRVGVSTTTDTSESFDNFGGGTRIASLSFAPTLRRILPALNFFGFLAALGVFLWLVFTRLSLAL